VILPFLFPCACVCVIECSHSCPTCVLPSVTMIMIIIVISSLCYLIITIIIIVWHCFFSSLFLIKPLRKHEFYSLSCCYSVFWCRHLNKGKRRWPISSVIIAIITNTQIGFSRNDDNVFPSQTHKRARTRTRTHKQTHTRSTPTHFYFASSFVFNSTF